MATEIGSLRLQLEATSDKFTRDMKQAERSIDRFGKQSKRSAAEAMTLQDRMAKFGGPAARMRHGIESAMAPLQAFGGASKGQMLALGGVGLAAGAGFGIFKFARRLQAEMAQAAQEIDTVAKTSAKIGIATESLIGYRYAAELTGVQTTTLDTAINKMNFRVAEAAQGMGEARDSLRELGIDAERLAGMKPEDQFLAIGSAINKLERQGDKARITMKIFDDEAIGLVNTFAMGPDFLRTATEEMERFGVAVSAKEAAKVESMNDAITRAGEAFSGLATQLTVAAAPMVDRELNRMTDSALRFFETIESGGESVAGFGDSFGMGFAALMKLGPLDLLMPHRIQDALQSTFLGDVMTGIQKKVGERGHAIEDDADGATRLLESMRDAERWQQQIMTPIERYDAEIEKLDGHLKEGRLTQEQYNRAAEQLKEALPTPELDLAAQIFESTRTDLERYNAEVDRLNDLHSGGHVDADTFSRAIAAAGEEYNQASGALDEYNRKMTLAESLIEEARTPTERFLSEIEEINDLHMEGFLGDQTFGRLLEKRYGEIAETAIGSSADQVHALGDVAAAYEEVAKGSASEFRSANMSLAGGGGGFSNEGPLRNVELQPLEYGMDPRFAGRSTIQFPDSRQRDAAQQTVYSPQFEIVIQLLQQMNGGAMPNPPHLMG